MKCGRKFRQEGRLNLEKRCIGLMVLVLAAVMYLAIASAAGQAGDDLDIATEYSAYALGERIHVGVIFRGATHGTITLSVKDSNGAVVERWAWDHLGGDVYEQRLGCEVTLVEVLERILPMMEPDISETLAEILKGEGMEIITKARIVDLSKHDDHGHATVVTNEGPKSVEFDALLLATGRVPNTDKLNLEAAGVETDGRGFIKVDETMRTTNHNIYAAGDCVSKRWMLETLSAREGVVAASNIVNEGSANIDYSAVPVVVFTDPQVGMVGLTEREVVEKYGACSCRVVPLAHVAKARMTKSIGLAKLVIKPGTGEVVGAHFLSPNSAEYVTEAALYIKHKREITDIIDTIHVFPTYAEALKLSAQAFLRPLSRMSCCVE